MQSPRHSKFSSATPCGWRSDARAAVPLASTAEGTQVNNADISLARVGWSLARRGSRALLTLALAAGLGGCGAVDAALQEEAVSSATASASPYTEQMYLHFEESQRVGISPDPSGSLALSEGDMSWAQSVQALVAEALKNRLPGPPSERGFEAGAEGVPELVLYYMPVGDDSGEYRGDGSSIVVVIPAVPDLAAQPRADQEEDVTGRYGKGAAWAEAKEAYLAAYDAASQAAAAASAQIAEFVLAPQGSDVYGSVNRMAARMGNGSLLILGDLKDMGKNPNPTDLSGMSVVAVQACTGEAVDCEAAQRAFSEFVVQGGAQAPVITGHETARQTISQVLTVGG